jgi:hypothetical protein
MGFRAPPLGGPHFNKAKLHAARHERSGNQGVGDDVKHLGGAISRIVSRSIGAIVRRMPGSHEE